MKRGAEAARTIARPARASLLVAFLAAAIARADPPLALERTLPLPNVAGRIDHLCVDLARKRLFVAELGNGMVGVVDLDGGAPVERIAGLREPQGIAYVRASDRFVVAEGDGTVRIFRANDLSPAADVALGDDADNVRVDPRNGRVLVGYGGGGMAVIDPATGTKLADVPLPEHPEGLQLDAATDRVYVNLPERGRIAVLDLRSSRGIDTWRVPDARSNFPLAIDAGGTLLASAFRKPPRLVLVDAKTGALTHGIETCSDADDVFFDTRRSRIYVSCGEGVVDVFAHENGGLRRVARVATARGARTSLFVPELDRLFVAAPATGPGRPAAILVLRPGAP
jgi:hypothetical protein